MSRRADTLLLTAMVLLGSCLSFGMEPMVGRLVVPFYGGAVHVWVTCLMAFQGLLLLGYAYAHLVAPRIGGWHLLVLLVPLLQWPLGFSSPYAPDAPIGALLAALMRTISLPFAVLTTTSVVAQLWWSRSRLSEQGEPFWLYAASNVGSLAALLAYPLIVEPLVGLSAQTQGWSALYLVYAVLAAAAWFRLRPVMGEAPALAGSREDPVLAWLLLTAAPSALLLGTTNHIAHEVGSFPLVWVLPMALYLGSFIPAFAGEAGWLARASRGWMLWLAAQIVLFAAFKGNVVWVVLVLSFVPFTMLCIASHRMLYELRPPTERLTTFYLWMSVGGFLGGTAVTLGAPALLDALYEPYLAVAAVGIGLAVGAKKAAPEWTPWGEDAGQGRRFAGYLTLLLLVAMGDRAGFFHGDVLARHRSFYGVYRIEDASPSEGLPPHRRLVHGGTVHGIEGVDGRAGAYYHPGSPLDDVVQARPEGPANIGVIGLGTGAMAGMIDADDHLVFYEIHGEMAPLVREWFGFLDGSPGSVDVVVGDARLMLQEEQGEDYDVLVVDAFAGDGIPVHLVTREAWAIYLDRVADDGLLAMHISNRFYDLRPVLAKLGAESGLVGRFQQTPAERASLPTDFPSQVVVFARDEARLAAFDAAGWRRIEEGQDLSGVVWTDDYSGLLGALRLN
ncbi:MAG: hypothetical protein EP330_08150 [Deltaproteobacteria bacterium]|nr:MAG: hypothetical protein EP330_08150 [Deltaproteobacteria bacterium]